MNTIKEDYKKILSFYKTKKVFAIILSIGILGCLIFAWQELLVLFVIGYSIRLIVKANQEKKNSNAKKTCPHCKEEVKFDATRCPHCHGKISHFGVGSLFVVILFTIVVVISVSSSVNNANKQSIAPVENKPTISPEELAKWKLTPAGKLCTAHPTWTKEDCESLIKKEIWVGMSYDMLVYLMGKPNNINPSDYGNGIKYQYCWTDHNPGCFYDHNDDGIIDSYN